MNNTSSRNLDLIDRYLQAVRFWLPKTNRQEDLLAELGEDLRSQIEDKETELGHPVDRAEMSAILKRCGSPMMVAGRLGPQRHLIGPALFPIYEFVLKMVLLWILVPVFIFIVGPVNLAQGGGDWGSAVLNTFGDLWSGLFIAAGIITLVFAIIERTSAHLGAECKWDPLKLPPVRKEERKPSLLKAVCEFGFNIFGLVWLLLVPHYPFLILGPAAAILKAGPLLHTFYLPFVLISVVALVRSGITLARPQWGWFPLLSQVFQSVLMLILLNYMIEAIGRTPSAFLFVVLQDAVLGSHKYVQLAGIVNVSILVSVVFTWLGVCIAAIIQTWQFMRYLRKRSSGVPRATSIEVQ
ncbi:MAG TPA: hypothetical protein VIX37_00100 [Candidatus Sulfotelmatobacter sp.]